MNIQIRSFIKGGNHGQYLQALGVRYLIKNHLPDAEVSHLDYNNHEKEEFYIQLKGFHLAKYLTMKYYWNKNFEFSGFDSSDITVYGSDMIWHLESGLFPGDPVFFGDRDSGKKLAYAPSVAHRGKNEPDWLGGKLDQFEWIGVRDENTAGLVKDHSNKEPVFVIDPCFHLLNSPHLTKLDEVKRKNVVSIYSSYPTQILASFKQGVDHNDYSEQFERVDYYGYFPRKKFLTNLKKQFQNPIQTVYGIAESKLLLTSTFHGVMMALMTKTPFIAVSSPNLYARLQSPINKCFGSHRLISKDELNEINIQQIRNYLDTGDLNFKGVEKYISESRIAFQDQLSLLVQN